jgi:predicted N-acetyltransferase YhbS
MRLAIRPVGARQELAQSSTCLAHTLASRSQTRTGALRSLPADRSLMLLAEAQGRIVGGALAFQTDPDSPAGGGTLRLVAVTPPYCGMRLGRRQRRLAVLQR